MRSGRVSRPWKRTKQGDSHQFRLSPEMCIHGSLITRGFYSLPFIRGGLGWGKDLRRSTNNLYELKISALLQCASGGFIEDATRQMTGNIQSLNDWLTRNPIWIVDNCHRTVTLFDLPDIC
jgi:hypothetical protein